MTTKRTTCRRKAKNHVKGQTQITAGMLKNLPKIELLSDDDFLEFVNNWKRPDYTVRPEKCVLAVKAPSEDDFLNIAGRIRYKVALAYTLFSNAYNEGTLPEEFKRQIGVPSNTLFDGIPVCLTDSNTNQNIFNVWDMFASGAILKCGRDPGQKICGSKSRVPEDVTIEVFVEHVISHLTDCPPVTRVPTAEVIHMKDAREVIAEEQAAAAAVHTVSMNANAEVVQPEVVEEAKVEAAAPASGEVRKPGMFRNLWNGIVYHLTNPGFWGVMLNAGVVGGTAFAGVHFGLSTLVIGAIVGAITLLCAAVGGLNYLSTAPAWFAGALGCATIWAPMLIVITADVMIVAVATMLVLVVVAEIIAYIGGLWMADDAAEAAIAE